VTFASNAAEAGPVKLWARRKISDTEIAHHTPGQPRDADKTLLSLVFQHQFVTRLTSLVTVDATPIRPEGEPLKLTDLPLNLPAGWDFAKVFGDRPQLPAPLRERRADAGDIRAQAAMKRALPAPMPDAVRLPKTATDAELKMIAGSVLLMLGLMWLLFNRRQRFAN
jgi:Ca-activated chloride channel family protein